MEPLHEKEQKSPQPDAKPKRKRFRIVKLEERIAPGHGHGSGHKTDVCGTGICTYGGETNCCSYY